MLLSKNSQWLVACTEGKFVLVYEEVSYSAWKYATVFLIRIGGTKQIVTYEGTVFVTVKVS